jgi:hypothetical protein
MGTISQLIKALWNVDRDRSELIGARERSSLILRNCHIETVRALRQKIPPQVAKRAFDL